ncbi:MAG: alpha/beta hydrolase [Anaeroplasma bactoclasticum]|nr:alpha/beta hydrolase [Anaeroplasma bactoclasticum]MCM1557368.1 alpha/beta hydrolase [Anaeroplasma bactoclasticum]
MQKIIIPSKYDALSISAVLYDTPNPKGIIQIVHGMKEHQMRYERFARFLNENGYIVLTSDVRGHGTDAKILGHMEGKKPWEALVLDQVTLSDYLKTTYPNLKLYLFAHSMGTIISRNLIQKHSDLYEKVILSGVPAYQKATFMGIFMANLIGIFKGNTYVSKFLTNLTDGSFIKTIKNPKTPVDWLSYNEENVNYFLNNPYCNIPFSVSAYKTLYHLVWGMHKSNRYFVIAPTKPILLLAGKDDPCTLGPKGLKHSANTLKKAGYRNVTTKIYENMRHEILNENNYEIVYEDILNFLEK